MSRQADIEAIQRGLPSSAPAASDLLPAGSQLTQLLQELEKVFRPVRAAPGKTGLDDLMFDAGRQAVIDWIRQRVAKQVGRP